MKSVSILDIARKTGLSRNTVAKALRFDPSVSYDTRMKTLRTAYDMNYPKLTEEALKELGIPPEQGEKKFLVLVSKVESEFWNRIVMGISDELRKHHGYCQLSFIAKEDEEQLVVPGNIAMDSLSGIICLYVFSSQYIEKIISLEKPLLFLDTPVQAANPFPVDALVVDGVHSVHQLTTELIRNHRKKIGFIGNIHYCQSIHERYEGFCSAMRDTGLPVEDRFCLIENMEDNYYEPKQLCQRLEQLAELPEAFVCANDLTALGVYRYCQKHHLSIPDDIALTGFDNIKESKVVTPRISTANIANYQLGRRLVQQMLWRLDNPEMPKELVHISAQTIIRASSGNIG